MLTAIIVAYVAIYLAGCGVIIWVLGARLGHGDERRNSRDPLDLDTEFL